MRTHAAVVADVLLVETEPEDIALFRRALGGFPGRLHVVATGPDALAFLRARPPALLIVNSRSPGAVDRLLEVISQARQAQGLPLPIHVFGPPVSEARIEDIYHFCSAYTVIPAERDRYEHVVRCALDYWLNRALLPPFGAGQLDLPEEPPQE